MRVRLGPWCVLVASAAVALADAEPASLVFREVAEARGLAVRHHDGGSGSRYMVETNGGGVTALDYDADGDDDLFFADGAPLPGYVGPPTGSRLLRNDGGRFVDVTAWAGLDALAGVYASGAAAGDVDGDGDLDLYVTAFGANQLLVNRGDGRFEVVEAGVEDSRWSSSAAFGDVDRDGDLDLYVTQYVDFTLAGHKRCGDARRGLIGYCGPDVHQPVPDVFYRNLGPGPGDAPRFEDATREAGLAVPPGAGLALCFGDFDADGWDDLYVANDLTPNFLFHNRGDGTFEDESLLSGTAYGPRGTPEAGMGVALGDHDGDGDLDIAVTNYEGEANGIYGNRGALLFRDDRFGARIVDPTLRALAFGVAWADFDHDGDLDLVSANGHVRDNAEAFSGASRYRQPNQILSNDGKGRYTETPGAGLETARASRGLAVTDLDGDGDLDLVFTNVDDLAEVYENRLPEGAGAWLQVVLRPRAGEPTVVGSGIAVEAGTRSWSRRLRTGCSYQSQHGAVLHVGLGSVERVDRVRVDRLPVDRSRRALRVHGVPSRVRLVF